MRDQRTSPVRPSACNHALDTGQWSRAMRGQRAGVARGDDEEGVSQGFTLVATGDWRLPESQGDWLFMVGGGRISLIRSTIGSKVPSSACTRRPDEINTDGNSSKSWSEQIPAKLGGGGGAWNRRRP
ncbi:poly(rC)-binding protein 3-like [Dorcoceras hygrometricum]|uniref:Poly(RC)-binding protein 3-like n=1 Tax=Dorcoceras hygrometricum TaxID=472368 RepID=A0A2Z7BAW8_9LAMI|nr:poly(rC)-binding protein 3-like [Dorcoceras hygrometricum]